MNWKHTGTISNISVDNFNKANTKPQTQYTMFRKGKVISLVE